jgi:hypothetical protein
MSGWRSNPFALTALPIASSASNAAWIWPKFDGLSGADDGADFGALTFNNAKKIEALRATRRWKTRRSNHISSRSTRTRAPFNRISRYVDGR